MSPLSSVDNVNTTTSTFTPKKFAQLSLEDLNAKFSDRQKFVENGKALSSMKSIMTPGAGECIVMLVHTMNKNTQRFNGLSGYHMRIDVGKEDIIDFLSYLDSKTDNIFIYLIGGYGEDDDCKSLLDAIKEAINESDEVSNEDIVDDLTFLIDEPNVGENYISVGLTPEGDINWCYGVAD